MAEEIILDYIVDQPNVPSSNVETQVKALLKITLSEPLRTSTLKSNTHLCLVLDVSASMRDQEMRELRAAAKGVVDLLGPGDVLSVIAFQSTVYEVVKAERLSEQTDPAALKARVDLIQHYRGGGTNMLDAITTAEGLLDSVEDASLTRKMVILTDGKVDNDESSCLGRAAEVSAKGIGIDAMGFGSEFDYKFMQRLASFSNGFTTKIDRPEEIAEAFAERVRGVTRTIANNVRLRLSFTPQVRAGRGYRYSPEMLYLGNIKLPGEGRDLDIPIGTIERDKAYSYLVTFTLPQREVGPMRAIKAELFYDVPVLKVEGGSSTQSIVVHYTDDPQQAAVIHGEVERAFDEVEIGRLVEELEKATGKQDHKRASMFFDILSRRYTELGDEAMAQHYVDLKNKYTEQGAITQDDMNYTRHRATQKKEGGVELVDASNLI